MSETKMSELSKAFASHVEEKLKYQAACVEFTGKFSEGLKNFLDPPDSSPDSPTAIVAALTYDGETPKSGLPLELDDDGFYRFGFGIVLPPLNGRGGHTMFQVSSLLKQTQDGVFHLTLEFDSNRQEFHIAKTLSQSDFLAAYNWVFATAMEHYTHGFRSFIDGKGR